MEKLLGNMLSPKDIMEYLERQIYDSNIIVGDISDAYAEVWLSIDCINDVLEKFARIILDIQNITISMRYDYMSQMAAVDLFTINFEGARITRHDFIILLSGADKNVRKNGIMVVSKRQKEWIDKYERGCNKFQCSEVEDGMCKLFGIAGCISECGYKGKCEVCVSREICGMTEKDFQKLYPASRTERM